MTLIETPRTDQSGGPADAEAAPPCYTYVDDRPDWVVRSAVVTMLIATAVLYLWGLSASGYTNSFYSATARPEARIGRHGSSVPWTAATASPSTSRRPRSG
ncbi:MAG: hypothetical protein WAL91_02140 [Propionicimonas sp.]